MDPATFLTFGIGPRNCIGMRFAEFQMHIALAILIRRFRFFPGPKTPVCVQKNSPNLFGFLKKFPVKVLSMDMLRPAEPLVVMAESIVEGDGK
jgi:cytochrome P450